MFKFLCVALLPLAFASAEYLYGDAYNYNSEYASAYDNYKPRDYKFEYGVSDPHTGDHKSQWEVRENGVVRGAYSLLEADGTTRIVDYYADDTGFHADVKKVGTAVHAQQEQPISLAPIVKNQIIDSIAYNGYGHGGLEHGYGAPIAAVQHVAAPVAKEVVVEAPVQKVEQIIEPQVQHVYQQEAPLTIEKFAPIAPAQYIKHLAPQSFGPTFEQIVKYAPVPQYYQPKVEPYYPAPVANAYAHAPEAYYPVAPVAKVQVAPAKLEAYYQQAPIQQYYQAPIAKVAKIPYYEQAQVAKVAIPEVHVANVQGFAPHYEQVAIPQQAYYPQVAAKVQKPVYYEQVAIPQQQQSFIISELAKIAPHIEPKYKDALTYAQPAYHTYPEY